MLSRVRPEIFRWRQALRRSAAVRPRARFAWREITRRAGLERYDLRCCGLALHVRHGTGDVAGVEEVFVHGNYDPPAPVAALLARLAAERPLKAVDVGANIGLFCLALFARFPDAHVVCFEPDSSNAAILERTRQANGRQATWQLVEACAGAKAAAVAFRGGEYMESRIALAGEAGTVTVQQVDVFEHLHAIDWLKIDAEGAEWAIVSDPRFAALEIPVISLEYHPLLCPSENPTATIVRLLGDAGYRITPHVERQAGLGELWAWREPRIS